jgi:hypothetical protein
MAMQISTIATATTIRKRQLAIKARVCLLKICKNHELRNQLDLESLPGTWDESALTIFQAATLTESPLSKNDLISLINIIRQKLRSDQLCLVRRLNFVKVFSTATINYGRTSPSLQLKLKWWRRMHF